MQKRMQIQPQTEVVPIFGDAGLLSQFELLSVTISPAFMQSTKKCLNDESNHIIKETGISHTIMMLSG
jgi:hypothetical protein